MSNYFEKMPIIKYGDYKIRDITRRSKFVSGVRNTPFVFMPYTIQEEDRPEDVAYYYYGSEDFVWVVFLSAGIKDPYNDWPKNQLEFTKYLANKYSSKSGKTGFDTIQWTQNTTITDNIVYYYREYGSGILTLPPASFYQPGFEASKWTAKRIYEHETDLNEEKRHIQLIDKSFLTKLDEDMAASLK